MVIAVMVVAGTLGGLVHILGGPGWASATVFGLVSLAGYSTLLGGGRGS